jgi:hypothetical protein
MHSLLKLFMWSGRRWSGGRNRSVRRPPALSVERYGADLLEPRRMMAVVGFPDEPAANVSVAANWAASALASATDGFTYTVNDGRAAITGYTGNDTTLVIPSIINGLAVASIAPQAFYLRGDLTSITLPESITSIGADAFNGCVGLTSFIIPDGVVSIGITAFSQCRSLTAVTLPSAVTSIGSGAFTGCSGLQSIAISSSAANVAFGEFVFQGCTSLLTFSVGLGNAHYKSVDGLLLTSDGRSLLACPTGRNGYLVVPAGVSTIGQDAFLGCRGLTAISLPSELTSIGSRAFSYCDGLTGITIPASVSSIGYGAFWGCSSLESFSVEAGNAYFASIDGVLFTADGKLLLRCPAGKTGDFTVPSGVVSIGESAFGYCDRLTSIMLPAGLTSIGEWAFDYCTSLASITLPAGLTSIGGWAFDYCTSLASITLPVSLTSIGLGAFSGCTSLAWITVASANPFFKSIDGVLYDKQGSQLICYPGGKQGPFAVPHGVTSIGDGAFSHCTSLTSITLPAGLTSIEDWAFNYCISLTSITLPAGVTSIGIGAFRWCDSLTSITLPASVSALGDYAFNSCSKLTTLTFLGDAPQLAAGQTVFDVTGQATAYYLPGTRGWLSQFGGIPTARMASPVTDFTYAISSGQVAITRYNGSAGVVVIPETIEGMPVTAIGNSAFYECTGLTNITLPTTVTSIGSYAFHSCKSLTSLTLPAGLINIGDGAFSSCASLTSIAFPAGLTSIGEWAFSYCTRLTSVSLPTSLTSIGEFAFSICTSLASIAVADSNSYFKSVDGVLYDKQVTQLICYPGGKQGPFAVPHVVTSIGRTAFYFCDGLTSVSLPTSLKSIGDSAFAGCSSLTSITLPNGLTSITDFAFYGCTGLTSITLSTGLASIGNGTFSGCTSLAGITVADGNPSFKAVDGVLYDKLGSQLVCCPAGLQRAFAVPQGVTSIRDSAFRGCNRLTGVTLPNGLTNIGDWAFCDCTSLVSVVIPVGISVLGDGSFNGCSSLITVAFLGDAPRAGSFPFLGAAEAKAYYLPGTHGWLSQFGGIPTAPITLPSVPGSLGAVRGNTAATLTWATPASDGHAPISDYVIQYRRATTQAWSTFQHVSSAATTTVVTGLANRQAYVFRVAAVNALGQGSWSTQSSAVIPLPPPSAPGRPVGAAGNGVVSLRFLAPQATGGLRVTDYVIQYSANSGASWTTAADSVSPLTTATVRGLSNGTSYIFRVAAVTAGGVGAFSASSAPVIPFLRTAIPAAPASVIGVGSGGTVSLSWTASSSNAGGPIRDYVIQYRSAAAGSRWFTYTDGVTSANAATVRRLVAGRAYVFRVAAKNLAGQGTFSSPSAAITA